MGNKKIYVDIVNMEVICREMNQVLVHYLGGFITEWTVSGDTSARTITLPLYDDGTFNCGVNWGDGSTSTITSYADSNRIHTYDSDGVYNVEISGECPGWSFNFTGDKLKITNIISWGSETDFGGFSYLIGGFYGCANLKTLGTGKIISNSTHELTNLSLTFFGCESITSITSGLFDNLIDVEYISNTFRSCISLQSIPSGLFDKCTKVIDMAWLFYDCQVLTTVPSGLFDKNILNRDFINAFNNCMSLETVPNGLFRLNTVCTDFNSTFNTTPNLQLNPWIFYNDGEQSSRFSGQTIDFTWVFLRRSFTGNQGTAPDLWNCTYGGVTSTEAFFGSGNSLTSIDNYGDIPIGWK